MDPFLAKIEEWVDRSDGKVRADVVLRSFSRSGSRGRSGRAAGGGGVKANACRAAAGVSAVDRGAGDVGAVGLGSRPGGGGTSDVLWCAWLAWCRFRVVIPTWDSTLPTVIACLDGAMRRFGGAPTYWLTDNEKTVTVDSCGRDRGAATR